MRLVFLLLTLSYSFAHANKTDTFKANTSYASALYSSSITQSSMTTLVDPASNRNTMIETLFGSESAPFKNDGLSWPPLPRFWGMEGKSKYVDAKFSIGTAGLPIGQFTFERAVSYKYEVTTTFHYLGSLKMVNRKSENSLNSLLPEDFEKIFKKNYDLSIQYFNVSSENPIVGMCQYELALYHGVSTKGGASFILAGIVEGGEVNFSRLSVYSRIFNIKPEGPFGEHSDQWYLQHECTDRFEKFVKPFVDEQFSFKARQYLAYFHPHNTCEPATPVPNKNDILCEDWHESFWSKKKKQKTVARCEMHTNGESHCVLKSKVGQPCSMYYTDGLDTSEFNLRYLKEGKKPPSRPLSSQDHGPYSLATIGASEYPCDKGLVCSMDTQTTATCKKPKTSRNVQ